MLTFRLIPGLGSSSSFTVGLLSTLYALQGRLRTKAALAAGATRIEQEVIGESPILTAEFQ